MTAIASGTCSSVSSEREMPTVTVLAWCLIASTGRVSSSMPRVSEIVRSSTTTAGVPILPYSTWYASSGRDAEPVAEQRRQPHGGGRFEVAVVRAGAQPVEEARAGGLERGPHAAQQLIAVGADPAAERRHR